MKKKLLGYAFMAMALATAAGCAAGTIVSVDTPAPAAQAGTPASGGEIVVPGVSIQVYAPGPNPQANSPDAHGAPANIVLGIWHGIISPVTLVVSFFNPNVQMYEVRNDGSPYNLGFLVGVAIVFVLLGIFAGSRRR
ncbi:MAG: hypothetical protein JW748_13655 [Anaerolineales bacterium]|nr:hypothetical protein [Anaerolineales bacterium]